MVGEPVIKILFCNYEYPPVGGGGGVICRQLAEELVRQGHKLTVLTSRAGDLLEHEMVEGVELRRLNVVGRNSMAAASFLSMATYISAGLTRGRRLLSDSKFDLVNTHFAVPTGPLGVRLANQLGVPNVLTVHGGDAYDPSKKLSPHRHAVLRSVVRHVANSSHCTIVNSKDTRNNVHKFYGETIDVRVLPYGIREPIKPDGTTRADLDLADDDFVMVAIGRMVRRKQMDQLIQSVAKLNDPRVKLCLLGEGPQMPDLKGLAKDLGVEAQVKFTGFVDEETKYRFLWQADIFSYTSEHEGFGIVFLEAMSCGSPVVCYNNGGQTDFIRHNENGLLIDLNNIDEFASACRSLMANTRELKKLAKAATETAETFFVERYAKSHIEIFEEALRNK